MKKSILAGLGMLLVSLSAIAEKNPQPGTPVIIVKEYFGTEASNDANNPCKGETTRVCYRETQTITVVGPGQVRIEKIGERLNGQVENLENRVVNGTIESVVNEMRSSLPANGKVYTVPTNANRSRR